MLITYTYDINITSLIISLQADHSHPHPIAQAAIHQSPHPRLQKRSPAASCEANASIGTVFSAVGCAMCVVAAEVPRVAVGIA